MRKHIIWSFDKTLLQKLLDESDSYDALFKELNLNVSKSLIKMLRYRGKIDNLNYDFFTKKNRFKNKFKCGNLSDILVENSKYYTTNTLKKRLIKEKLLEYKCSICELSEWNNKELVLQLDHINGVSNDNRINNLRLLCPNCHSQTDTYAGKKKKVVKLKRLSECMNCKNVVINRVFCKICSDEFATKNRKIERPGYEILLKEIEELGYSATGRKYGVSDNAVRKWIKNYENKV